MTHKAKVKSLIKDTANPQLLLAQFKGNSPLLPEEDKQDFGDFLLACISTVQPADAIEEVWLSDFINHQWEARRWQRIKIGLLRSSRQEAVERLLRDQDASQLLIAGDTAEGWATGDKASIAYVENFLELRHLDGDAINAKAFQLNSKIFEQLDNQIASSEYRRDKALRELDLRRELIARRAKESADNIQDAEFQDFPTKTA